jgi:Fic family protein
MRFFKRKDTASALTHRLLQSIRLIGEYKGKQDLYLNQTPQTLERLQEIAVIQSAESSNRIEGVTAPPERIEKILKEKTAPRNRSEQEIVAYRNVLDTIHTNHEQIPFTVGTVLQFHRDLYGFKPGFGGRWKSTNNDIIETREDGTTFVRFIPVRAHLAEISMRNLHEDFARMREAQEIEPLMLIASYVLDFLCIHPFADGNGRMARLLTLLLLYKEGYVVGRYISLEQIVEKTKESYYDTLYQCSQGWHENTHGILPWFEYIIGVVLLTAYQEFESRVGVITRSKGAKGDAVQQAIARLPQRFKFSDIERSCPGVSAATVRRTLENLKKKKQVRCIKAGKDALWEKSKATFWDQFNWDAPDAYWA